MEAKTDLISLPEHLRSVVYGLCIGDALGATSEFQIPWEVGKNCVEVYEGWPNKLVGGGVANWEVGKPTDDSEMAIAIVRSVLETNRKFDSITTLKHFIRWIDTRPKDVGHTTRYALVTAKKLNDPYIGAKRFFNDNPQAHANGSLMRNGVIAAFFHKEDQEIEAIDATVSHATMTHYSPLSVVCCVVHTLLIRYALLNRTKQLAPPTLQDIEMLLKGPWKEWKAKTTNKEAKEWMDRVTLKAITQAENQLLQELKDFEKYNPYIQDYRGRSGYCVLTLLLSLWALYWSFQTTHPAIPDWLPKWPFERHGFDALMWVVLIGADADTYGATAGPLLAAYHPNISVNYKEGLLLREEIDKIAF